MQEVIPGLNKKIRRVQDFPKKGIIFWDVTTLFRDPDGLKKVIDTLVEHYKGMDIDCIASIESRGFIIGSAVAYLLGVGFVLIRKKGKLPYDTIEESYECLRRSVFQNSFIYSVKQLNWSIIIYQSMQGGM